jgi:hypothetical protein
MNALAAATFSGANPIANSREKKEACLEQLARDPHAKLPLMRVVHRDPQGQPLKTALANKFPLLSRRERRELMREAIKAQTTAAKKESAHA